jgi:hypothetical protein
LDALNEKAEMLSRIDNKYVLRRKHLSAILPALTENFDVLAIDNLRAFTYDTRYFDDAERSAYYEHHQGVRKGFKVRVRRYTDSDLCFLEVKVKSQRGMTEKFRRPYDPTGLDALTPEARTYASETYAQQYGKPFHYQLAPALDVRYRRITLVGKTGGERMTIDTDLRFTTPNAVLATGTGVFIVETKSANGRGFADLTLRSAHERPTKRCSKYCIGMAALGEVSRYNHFLPTMRKLGMIAAKPSIGRWSEIRPDLCQKFALPGTALFQSAAA